MVEKGRAALTAPALGAYAARRVLRIYPLFLVYLGLALISSIVTYFLFGAMHGVPLNMPPTTFLRHVLLLEGKGVLWSIVVEFKYYALLPFVAVGFGLAARRGTGILLLALVGALILVELTWRRWVPAGDELSLGYYLPIFLGGAALGAWDAVQTAALPAPRARVTGPEQISAADIGPQPVPMVMAATMAGLATAVFVLTIPDTASALVGQPLPSHVFHGEIVAWTVIWGALILGLRFGPVALRQFFGWRPLRYVGLTSFSLYLWHPVAIRGWRELGPEISPLMAWIPVLVIALLMAHLSYVTIERPFLTVKPVRLFRILGTRSINES